MRALDLLIEMNWWNFVNEEILNKLPFLVQVSHTLHRIIISSIPGFVTKQLVVYEFQLLQNNDLTKI